MAFAVSIAGIASGQEGAKVVAKNKGDKLGRPGWDQDLCTECKTRAERRERSCTKSHVPTKALRGEERKMVLPKWFSEFPMGGPRRK